MTRRLLLTRIRPNGAHADARRDYGSRDRRDQMHKTLSRLVDASRADGGVLWRYEHDKGSVLLQSSAEPDMSRLPGGYGTMEGPYDMAPHLGRLAHGHTVTFRLVANPVIRRRNGRDGPRHRAPVTGDTEQQHWLSKQLHTAGLDAANDGVRALTTVEPHPRDRGARLHVVQFDGSATITDTDRLCAAIAAGIGPSKSYGCGLLTVSRPLP